MSQSSVKIFLRLGYFPVDAIDPVNFYRAMHYSAKRGLEIACRLSVRPSVTLVDHDHVGFKSWKLREQLAQHLRSS